MQAGVLTATSSTVISQSLDHISNFITLVGPGAGFTVATTPAGNDNVGKNAALVLDKPAEPDNHQSKEIEKLLWSTGSADIANEVNGIHAETPRDEEFQSVEGRRRGSRAKKPIEQPNGHGRNGHQNLNGHSKNFPSNGKNGNAKGKAFVKPPYGEDRGGNGQPKGNTEGYQNGGNRGNGARQQFDSHADMNGGDKAGRGRGQRAGGDQHGRDPRNGNGGQGSPQQPTPKTNNKSFKKQSPSYAT